MRSVSFHTNSDRLTRMLVRCNGSKGVCVNLLCVFVCFLAFLNCLINNSVFEHVSTLLRGGHTHKLTTEF